MAQTEMPLAPGRKEILFAVTAPVPASVGELLLAACAEAASKEEDAETVELQAGVRTPLETLLEGGQIVGPFTLGKRGRLSFLTPTQLPLDSGDTEVGKDAGMFVLPAPNQRLQTTKVTIQEIRPDRIGVKETTGGQNANIPEGSQVYLTKNNTGYCRAVTAQLRHLVKTNNFWEVDILPPIDSSPDPADAPYFGRLRPGDAPKDAAFRKAFQMVSRPNRLCGIKGPPGTGKTHLVGLAATKLVNQGKKCLLISKSHRAIENALLEIAWTAKHCVGANPGIRPPRIGKKSNTRLPQECLRAGIAQIPAWPKTADKKSYTDPWAGHDIIGVTADSAVSRKAGSITLEEFPADYMFVEEAGQMPAFAVAALHAMAKNIVFLGDEDQLAPIVRAAHSAEWRVGESALSFLQHRQPTRVLSLPVTHRLSAPICEVVGRVYYPDLSPALEPGRGADSHILRPGGKRLQGIYVHQIDHRHTKKSSPEEREAIWAAVEELLAGHLYQETPEDDPRPLTPEDFCVLSPFRLQSNLIAHGLRHRTGHEFLTGTIHKLQGQGRPIVLTSLCASNFQFLGNTAEWFFAPNMWNVTISRAKALCVIFGNVSALRECRPKTLRGISYKAQMLELLEGRPELPR